MTLSELEHELRKRGLECLTCLTAPGEGWTVHARDGMRHQWRSATAATIEEAVQKVLHGPDALGAVVSGLTADEQEDDLFT